MAVQNLDTLKSYFNLRKVPTPSNYADLIDTIFAQSSSGEIAGLTISSNPGASASILATNAEGTVSLLRLNADVIGDRSGSNITLAPTGDIVLNPGGNDIYPLTTYDLNLGQITKKFLAIHAAELWVETLVAASTMATIGGRVLIGPTTVITLDMAAGDTTIYVKHNEMANGDIIYLEENGNVEFMQVTWGPAGSGPYAYGVTRNLDGSGANNWYAGTAAFNTGTTGNGFIDLYSLRGVKSATQYGPTIVGNVRSSTTYNDWTEHWAIGNLNGVYGYGSDTYGFAAGKYANSESFVTVDATNGIRILARVSSLDTTKFQVQADGDLFIGENVSTAATTFMSVFVNAQTYNSESMSAGDVLLGDNSASKANILWDKSAGKLLFRGGTTTQVEIDTTGAIVAGTGNVIIDATGITVAAEGVGYGGDEYRYKIQNGISTMLEMRAYEGSGGVPWFAYITATGMAVSHEIDLFIEADNGEIYIKPYVGGGYVTNIQSDAYVSMDLRVGAGLYVGDTGLGTDPGSGEIIATSKIFVNETVNSKQTIGITINQGTATDESIALKNSDVAHGVTDTTETDTYGFFAPVNADGGMRIRGITEVSDALNFYGLQTTGVTTKSTSAAAAITFTGGKKSGTAPSALGADENIVRITSHGSVKFIFDSDGDMWYTGNLQAYRNSATYTGCIFVPLTTPFTSTNWDGNDTKTTGTYAIDLSTEFSTTLVGVKAVLVRLSGHFATPEYSAVLRPRGSSVITARMLGQVANIDGDITVVVPTDSTNFDIDVVIAGGSMTQAILEIWGYWI